MAILRNTVTGRECRLVAEHLIGRSSHCDLQLNETFVSSQHAAIRWTGAAWELNDLGSRNGTWLNGQQLDPHSRRSSGYELERDAVVAFGHMDHAWALCDDAPPAVMAVPLGGGSPVLIEDDMLGIPSPSSPEVAIVRAPDGGWRIESSDGTVTDAADGTIFEVLGASWRFCCPNAVANTATVEDQCVLRDARLRFEVSADEEHVALSAEVGFKIMQLGSRAHNYCLLTLARHRLEDMAAGILDSSCGWIYLDDLLRELAITQTQLNVDIFRLRGQFAALGFRDPAAIVERRPRTKQLRIGVGKVVITRV